MGLDLRKGMKERKFDRVVEAFVIGCWGWMGWAVGTRRCQRMVTRMYVHPRVAKTLYAAR
jgi:hypothetical protein